MGKNNKFNIDHAKTSQQLGVEYQQTALKLGQAVRDEQRARETQGECAFRMVELEEAFKNVSEREQKAAAHKAKDEAAKAAKKAKQEGEGKTEGEPATSTPPAGNDAEPNP